MAMVKELSESAYVVLGLLEVYGPGTPYDLKRWADGSIGYFWAFPRAQLYVEPPRLVKLGLLEETREADGRRRRVFRLTSRGRARLRSWLRDGAARPHEIRDPGLLKLYFSTGSAPADIAAIARTEAAAHRARLREYQGILPSLLTDDRARLALATLRFGLLYERLAIRYWTSLERGAPKGTPR